jgi:hypothetical protein
VRRAIVIFAIAWFVALGSGAVEYAHNAQHAMEDAQRGQSDRPNPHHDDSNCPVHAQLHLPLIAAPAVVLLICAGLLVAFVTQLAPEPVCVHTLTRIDCRGPPCLV